MDQNSLMHSHIRVLEFPNFEDLEVPRRVRCGDHGIDHRDCQVVMSFGQPFAKWNLHRHSCDDYILTISLRTTPSCWALSPKEGSPFNEFNIYHDSRILCTTENYKGLPLGNDKRKSGKACLDLGLGLVNHKSWK